MLDLLNWLDSNKQWVFSGIGVFIISVFLVTARWFFTRKNAGQSSQISKAGFSNTQGEHFSTTIQGSNVAGGNQVVYNINPPPLQPTTRPKNVTGAALAQKVHTLSDTFLDSFKDIIYPGLPLSEVENPKQSFLLERFRKTAEIFKELYDQARKLKPFLESAETIEEILDSVSRLAQGYKIAIGVYLQERTFAQQEESAGLFASDQRSRQLATAIEAVFGDGRRKRIDAIEEKLKCLQKILAEYIRENTE